MSSPPRPPDLPAAVGRALQEHEQRLAVAESLTGGLLANAFAAAPGASSWFLGGVVAYHEDTKHDVLGVPDVPLVSEACARAMAEGVARVLSADVTVAVTGVAGPALQSGEPPGTVWLAVRGADGEGSAQRLSFHGGPEDVCAQTVEAAVRAVASAIGIAPDALADAAQTASP